MFYMIHTQVDRIWWIWQSQDLSARLKQISGPTSLDGSGNTTLATTLDFGPLAPEIAIADVMDIQGGLLCYDYSMYR